MEIEQLENFQDKLLDRRKKLTDISPEYSSDNEIQKLLSDIDSALTRIENGTNFDTLQLDSNGIPLGTLCSTKYECDLVKMNSGDVLLIYTDGLIEAMKDEEMFGVSRLLKPNHVIRNMSSTKILEFTLAELHAFLDGSEKIDDLTILVLKKL